MHTIFVVLIFMLSCGCFAASAEQHRNDFKIKFKINVSHLDTTDVDNAHSLLRLLTTIDSIKQSPFDDLTAVIFAGSSSPDGPMRINRPLSARRLDAVKRYVCGRTAVPDSIVTVNDRVTDWNALVDMIAASDMPYKDEVIDIIVNTPEFISTHDGSDVEFRKNKLVAHRGGVSWRYMLRRFFPAIRSCSVTVCHAPAACPETEQSEEATLCRPESDTTGVSQDSIVCDSVAVLASDETPRSAAIPASAIVSATDSVRPFYMSLGTNMLYDALLVPNISVEFYLGKNWSISADWMYGWWDTDRRHRYWRIYGGDLAVRRWFGSAADRKPLTGHHAGVYASAFTYDFEFGGRGQMGGKPGGSLWDRANYAVGLEYGYSLPVASRFNIDFTIGAGYMWGRYQEYKPIDGHYVWQKSKQRRWFGPTRLQVSFIWLLGRGNVNMKGGAGQ